MIRVGYVQAHKFLKYAKEKENGVLAASFCITAGDLSFRIVFSRHCWRFIFWRVKVCWAQSYASLVYRRSGRYAGEIERRRTCLKRHVRVSCCMRRGKRETGRRVGLMCRRWQTHRESFRRDMGCWLNKGGRRRRWNKRPWDRNQCRGLVMGWHGG